jgi:hypothetical protein
MRRFLALIAAPLLLAAAPADLAGEYRLSGVHEAAGGLELTADGRFRYGLSYGALDEQAEGTWRLEGNRVRLTTDPPPRPPEWTLVYQEKGEPALFQILLEGVSGQPIATNIEVQVRLRDGSVEKASTRAEWLEAPLDGGQVPVSLQFHVPVFEVSSPEFPIDLDKGHRLRFRLDPRDMGVRNFQDWPLEIRDGLLAPPDAPSGQGFRRVGKE